MMNHLQKIAAENACANEPIQFSNAIQPHGLLLVADDHLIVCHVAGDVENQLGTTDIIGRPLINILGRILTASISSLDDNAMGGMIGQLRTSSNLYDVFVRRTSLYYIIEIEDSFIEEVIVPSTIIDHIAVSSSKVEDTSNFDDVCRHAAEAFRDLTGYDRVMVYRFLEDGTGHVVAENRNDILPSFLNQRFPASDIPSQARALYCRNVFRSIPDVNYTPQVLRPAWTDAYPLDMSDVTLRSVSPIHIEYLKNMGVEASVSCSIIRNGKLWGLIAGHHSTPRRLSYTLRSACRLMVENFSRQIKVIEEAENVRIAYELQKHEANITRILSTDRVTTDIFSDEIMNEIRLTLSADGLAIIRNNDLVTNGFCPVASDIQKLASWLLKQSPHTIFATDRLQEHYPDAANFVQMSSGGIVSMPISADAEWMVIWFRAEQIETINWAGNPHKELPENPLLPLRPRFSFETWRETVHGRSAPWTPVELDSVTRMRQLLTSNNRLAQLTDQIDGILQNFLTKPVEKTVDSPKKKSRFRIFGKKQ